MSIHVGIFGPSLCGKTHAAKQLSLAMLRSGRRSLVSDPNRALWGPQALIFGTLDEAFLRAVWRYKNCAVFIDEATISIDRDAAFTDLFTRSRHAGHIIHVMGHRATVLLPIQRDQFGTLLLFRQSPSAAKIWGEEWAEDRIDGATRCKKYEFLYCKKFAAVDGSHLIQKGKFPPPPKKKPSAQ